MITSTHALLTHAQNCGYAVGAFNVYNLEGVRAVISAAEQANSPVLLQLHPQAIKHGGRPLVALCLEAARCAQVPCGVHLDHSSLEADIQMALSAGVNSIMADGSHLSYAENASFTARMTVLAHAQGGFVEAELGRLSGTEDGLKVAEREACLTNPFQAAEFVEYSGVDALAVCIGNVHGHYHGEPALDFARLAEIRKRVAVPLVLHGASGLSDALIQCSIELGICKLNVNTEVREAFVSSVGRSLSANAKTDLLPLMQQAVAEMQQVIDQKIQVFGSSNKAGLIEGGA